MRILTLLLGFLWMLNVMGQLSVLHEIQKMYLQQGIPFRENTLLDNLPILPEYDFVVVGSGPAGSAIANRLTEVPPWKVLLIEKGTESNIYNDIPLLNHFTVLDNFSKFYWMEKTSNACTGLINKQCSSPVGEVLGGSSIINGMIYTRGQPSDFDDWAKEGNLGWSYKDILPYFLKVENMTIPELRGSKYHMQNGPVNIEYPFQTKITERFLKAGRYLGFNLIDYNNPDTMIGFSRSQATMKSGKRHSAVSAYLMPIKDRTNLHVIKESPVTNIIIDPKTKIAKGVKFFSRGKERQVLVRNEVVISAGAFNSPKLLMLSGIGHKDQLEQLGIPVIQDLPVGDQLHEHLSTILVNFFINSSESTTLQKILIKSPLGFMQWLSGKGGVFSSNSVEALGYVKTPLAMNGKVDMELICIPMPIGVDGGLGFRRILGVSENSYFKAFSRFNFREGFSIMPMGMYPKSRGKLRLRSARWQDPPIIDGNFFADSRDVQTIIHGVRAAERLVQTPPFQEIGARLMEAAVPGCEKHQFDSDAYWECAIRAIPTQFHHLSGTCRMGIDPKLSVVDPRLRVHGISGLRVADASIIPHHGSHTMAPCYMIGEKAADLIKEDWGPLVK